MAVALSGGGAGGVCGAAAAGVNNATQKRSAINAVCSFVIGSECSKYYISLPPLVNAAVFWSSDAGDTQTAEGAGAPHSRQRRLGTPAAGPFRGARAGLR